MIISLLNQHILQLPSQLPAIPNAWPVHQNSPEDRPQVPSHLVVGSPGGVYVNCSKVGIFLGKKQMYIYISIHNCHLTRNIWNQYITSADFGLFRSNFKHGKNYIRIHQNQASCHLFPRNKRGHLSRTNQRSRSGWNAKKKLPVESDDAARFVLHHRRETGPPLDPSDWSMDYPMDLSWDLQYPEFQIR